MQKIKNLFNKGVAKVNEVATRVMHGDSHFVAIVVAIIVCIAIAAVFRTEITNFVTNIITQATQEAQNLF